VEFLDFWKQVKEFYEKGNSRVACRKVNCQASPKLCESEGITDYVEVKLYPKQNDNYDGSKYLKYFETVTKSTVEGYMDSKSLVDEVETVPYFAKFFTPNCPHCKHMASDWDELVKAYGNQSGFKLVAVRKLIKLYKRGRSKNTKGRQKRGVGQELSIIN
jgi:thiol-disulfide isomerase/thioredoxin